MAQNAGGFNSSGAAMSPPGAMSQRTDMQPQAAMQIPDAAYGEQQDYQQIQGGAPMAGQPAMPMPSPLTAPTGRPNEPITAGAPVGDGPGLEALPTDSVYKQDMRMIAKYLPQFEAMAADEATPEAFRLFVRFVRGSR